MKVEEVYKTAG